MKIHFVGSEGVSMKALAKISKSYGHEVSGSDLTIGGHNASNVSNADLVVYTTAVGADNVEIAAARQLNIKTVERAEYLGQISKNYKAVLAVAGSHGKTTASGYLAKALAHLNPTLHIGGSAQCESNNLLYNNTAFDNALCGNTYNNTMCDSAYDNVPSNASSNIENEQVNSFDYFITEACEYKRSFLQLHPTVGIILNIELDHTDYYKDYDDYLSAFRDFANLSKLALINGDDAGCIKIKADNCVTFGLGEHNDYRAVNIKKNPDGTRTFDVFKNGVRLAEVHTKLIGEHNIYNALAAIAAADCIGADIKKSAKSANGFSGMKRRFEFIKKSGESLIYTDYAHHPSELKTTVLTAREIGAKKLTIIFEPHTFSRTESMSAEFAHALSFADDIILTPIFPAREAPIHGVTTHNIENELKKLGKCALYFDTFSQVFSHLKSSKTDGEIIVFTGAGDGILQAVKHLRSPNSIL